MNIYQDKGMDPIDVLFGNYMPPEYYLEPGSGVFMSEYAGLIYQGTDCVMEYISCFPWLANASDKRYGFTALHIASECDDYWLAGRLLMQGANIHHVNIFGQTAYDVAISHISINTIKIIENYASNVIKNAWRKYRTRRINEHMLLMSMNHMTIY
jgi:hypothetical protein